MNQPRLQTQGITKRFGGVVAIDGVSLDVLPGEVHAICGENGAGKSTLMKVLSGAITEYDGQLVVGGIPVRFTGPRDAEQHGIGIIYQELNLVPELTAAANIFLGREELAGGFLLRDRTMERRAEELFGELGAKVHPRAKVRTLRIGDQQLVEIAKALSRRSDVLIMDEPTSALAETEVERLFRIVETLKRRGVTILYISHKMDEVFRIADRITVLRDGKHIGTREAKQTTPGEIIRGMVGREIASLRVEHPTPGETELLRVRDLCLPVAGQADRLRLKHIDFGLRRGELLGVAGLLGSGRTELLECLFGASKVPCRGTILRNGNPCRIDSPRGAIRHGLAMVTEDRKQLGLFAQMNVAENIVMSILPDLARLAYLSPRKVEATAAESVRQLAIRVDRVSASIRGLSGGNQQKCILARSLLTRPQVLLLDEPTRGIDVGAKAEIYVLLRRLCSEGLGIILTSSELPELLTVCDRILVLSDGRKTGEFRREEATQEGIMHAATAFS